MGKKYISRFEKAIRKMVDEKGVMQRWIADKLNMPPPQFYVVSNSHFMLTPKHWEKALEVMKGYLTKEDLATDYLIELLERKKMFKVTQHGSCWVVTLKDHESMETEQAD